MTHRHQTVLLAVLAALAVAGCGGSSSSPKSSSAQRTTTIEKVVTQATPASDVRGLQASFDPQAIYQREAPGVVTVVSILPGGSASLLGGSGPQEGVGSGFVISSSGEIATNAHVVSNGTGPDLQRARQVFVQFGDDNQVPAKIVGVDPNADVALIKVDPKGLTLRPLPLGSSTGLVVGSPVAAIGSPFDKAQSLSVGVISALDRSIQSLNYKFSINGAIQTDAAINHGNSGGPLLDAQGRVLGINSQIQSTGGGGEGVGFAVPIDLVKRSLDQIRKTGRASYSFLGVTTVTLFPQLVEHFHLPVKEGAWVQGFLPRSPARGHLRVGHGQQIFQVQSVVPGGDIITAVDGAPIRKGTDLNTAVSSHNPGDTVSIEVYRNGKKLTIPVKLADRPLLPGGSTGP